MLADLQNPPIRAGNHCHLNPQLAACAPPIHPGGLALTRHALALCGALPGALLLDLGCGGGASVALAAREFGLVALGLDVRVTPLPHGQILPAGALLIQAIAERLPLRCGIIDLILAECSLSVVSDRAATLSEIQRVLRPGGALIISDVYLRSPERAPDVGNLLTTMRRGLAHSCEAICAELATYGLTVEHWEDCSVALHDFACAAPPEAIATYWQAAPGVNPFDAALAIARARPGYLLLLARRMGRA